MKTISKIFIAFLLLLIFNMSNAQGINFQGVARSSNGTILASQKISLKLSIITGSPTSTPDYIETRNILTNGQGIFSVVIGDTGTITNIGSYANVNWKASNKYLKVEMDPTGGTSFISMGITPLQYVPYSHYSNGVDAVNVNGVLPVRSGGTGVSSIAELKTAIGLNKVENSADLDKPISTLTQAALDIKLNKADTISLSNRINNIVASSTSFPTDITVNGNLIGKGAGGFSTNLVIGKNSFVSNSTGSSNVMVGINNMNTSTTASRNVTIGYSAANSITGNDNVIIGDETVINSNSNSTQNVIIGSNAAQKFMGSQSVLIGFQAGQNSFLTNPASTQGVVAIGSQAGLNNLIGGGTFVGQNAGQSNTTGYDNTFIGARAGQSNSTGTYNTYLGFFAGLNNRTGSSNTFIGRSAGLQNMRGEYNTIVGAFSGDIPTDTTMIQSNNVVIGSWAARKMNGSNNLILGDHSAQYASVGNQNILIGSVKQNQTDTIGDNKLYIGNSNTNTPLIYGEFENSKLTVNGALTANSFKIPGGTSAQYLKADGSVATSVTAGVPYTGASQAVDLGAYDLKVNGVTVGLGLGQNNTNVLVGSVSMISNTTGARITSMGSQTLRNNTTGMDNTGIGFASLSTNTTGIYNSGHGSYALELSTTGSSNTAAGYSSNRYNTTGNNNTSIGFQSLRTNTTGSNNTAIGYNADVASNNLTNATAVGNGATVASSNTIQLGNSSVTDVKTTGAVTAAGFKTPTGTSSQYLMADGTVSSGSGGSGLTLIGKIIYMKNLGNGSVAPEIWIANYDGTGQTKVNVALPNGIVFGSTLNVSISPNGQKIFFNAGPPQSSGAVYSDTADIYSCNVDGSNVVKIIDRNGFRIAIAGAF